MLERPRQLWPWSKNTGEEEPYWEEHVVDEWAAFARKGDGVEAIAFTYYRLACAFQERDQDEMEEALEDAVALFRDLVSVSRVSHLRGAYLTYAAIATFARASFQQEAPFSFAEVLSGIPDSPISRDVARAFYGPRGAASRELDEILVADRDFYNEPLRILRQLDGKTKHEWLSRAAGGSEPFITQVYADARATVPDPERWPLCMLLERWDRWLRMGTAEPDAARLELTLESFRLPHAPTVHVRVRVANKGGRARNIRLRLESRGVRIVPSGQSGRDGEGLGWAMVLPGRRPPAVLLRGESASVEFAVEPGQRKKIPVVLKCSYDDRQARDVTISGMDTLILAE